VDRGLGGLMPGWWFLLPGSPARRKVVIELLMLVPLLTVLLGGLIYLNTRPELVWSLGQRAMMRQMINESVRPECLREGK